MRRTFLIVGTVAAFMVFPFLVAGIARHHEIEKLLHPPQAELPDDSQVVRPRATLYHTQVGFDSIPEFEVPPDHVPRMLFWFGPPQYEPRPPILPDDGPLGTLTITTKEGETRNISFFWAGRNPPVFTEDGVDFY